MKRVTFCILILSCLFQSGCEKMKEDLDQRRKTNEIESIGRVRYFRENTNEVFSGESILIGKAVIGSEKLQFYANLENDKTISYTLEKENGTLKFVKIDLGLDDLPKIRESFRKALEWGEAAIANNVERFEKQIPVTISSDRVQYIVLGNLKKPQVMNLDFFFSWNPKNTSDARARLAIRSNNVILISITRPEEEEEYSFISSYYNLSEIKKIYESLAPQNVQKTIASEQKKRADELEKKEKEALLFN